MTASEALATYAGEIDTLAGTLNARRTYFDQDASVARQKLNIVLASSGSARMDADVQLGLAYVAQIDKMSVGVGTLAGALTAFASYIRETVIPEFAEPERIAAGGAVGVFYEEIAPMGYSGYETNEAAWLAWANDKIAALEEKWRVETGPAEAAKLVAAAADIDAAYLVNVTDNGSFSEPVVTEGASGLMLQLFKEAGLDPMYTLTDLTPAEAATAVVDLSAAIDDFSGSGDPTALTALLDAHHADPVVMSRLLDELGPEAYYDLIGRLGEEMVRHSEYEGEFQQDAHFLRDGLEFALVVDSFQDGGFALAVSAAFAGSAGNPDSAVLDPYNQLEFILASPFLPVGFDLDLVAALADFEAMAGVQFSGHSGDDRPFPREVYAAVDPVAFLMDRISAEPATARALYSDPARTTYLVGERDYSSAPDGMTAMFESLAAAGVPVNEEHPDEPADDEVVRASQRIVTVAVAALGDRDDFDPSSLTAEASLAAATIVTAHMDAVEFSQLDSGKANVVNPTSFESMEDITLQDASKPWFEDDATIQVADLDDDGLALLVRSAGATNEGFAALSRGVMAHRGFSADRVAESLADSPPPTEQTYTEANAELAMYAQNTADVETYIFSEVFDENVTDAEERDARLTYWINAAETAIDWLPSKVGKDVPVWGQVGAPVVDFVTDIGADVVAGEFVIHEDQVVAEASGFFTDMPASILQTYVRAMQEAGVLVLPDDVVEDGVVDWDEVANRFETTTADEGWSLSVDDLQGEIKVEQFPEWIRRAMINPANG